MEIGDGPATGGFGTLLTDESFVGVEGAEAKAAQPGGSPVQFAADMPVTFGSDIARDPVSNHLVAATNDLSRTFRTDFYVGRKVVRKDRKAPFVHTQTISAGATAGSTVTVRARAFIKVKRGRGPKKSISTTVRVCS